MQIDHSSRACKGQTATPKNLICGERVPAWKRQSETAGRLGAWTVSCRVEEQR